MTEEKRKTLLGLFADAAVVPASNLRANGFSSRNIRALAESGILLRVRRGYYTLSEEDAVAATELETIAVMIPSGVFCLQTALAFHELATVNPAEIQIALPRNAHRPKVPEHLPVRYFLMQPNHYALGVDTYELNGHEIQVYNPAKTVCDCFKYTGEIEKSVAIEALRTYLARYRDTQTLLDYAARMRKQTTILPYLEASI